MMLAAALFGGSMLIIISYQLARLGDHLRQINRTLDVINESVYKKHLD